MSNRPAQRLLDLAWTAYEHAPQPLVDVAGKIKPFLQIYSDWRVPIIRARGSTHEGKPASLLIAGAGHSIEYLLGRFFSQPPCLEQIEIATLTTLPKAIGRLRGSADMTIAQVPLPLSRRLGGDEYLRVPPWVGTWFHVPDDPEQFAKKNKHVWDELRPARQNALHSNVTHELAEFDRFYGEMYEPYAYQRHGASAVIRPLWQLRRLFRRGGLVWIFHGDQRVAGGLFSQNGPRMNVISLGAIGDGERARKLGAIAATYHFIIKHARSQGCTIMDFGACRPSPADGVLFFKRKWAMHLLPRPLMTVDLLVRWEQPNEAVRSLISTTPLIFTQGQKLSLIAAPQNDDIARAKRLFLMEGIERMYTVTNSPSGTDMPVPGLSLVDGPAHQRCSSSDNGPA